MFRHVAISALCLYLLFAHSRAAAQGNSVPSTASAQVRYEVASVHPSRPEMGGKDASISFGPDTYKVGKTPSNRFDAKASTVGEILLMLNEWQPFRVVDGPQRINTDRYDIHAKADATIPPEEQRDTVLALLAKRFKLSVHHETRNVPTFVLLASKKTNGLKPASAGDPETEHHNGGNITYTAVPMSDFINDSHGCCKRL